jgi:hypothetical protein
MSRHDDKSRACHGIASTIQPLRISEPLPPRSRFDTALERAVLGGGILMIAIARNWLGPWL